MEAAAVRGRADPRLLRLTHATFPGSWANRPNLATQCLGRRAWKSQKAERITIISRLMELTHMERSASAVLYFGRVPQETAFQLAERRGIHPRVLQPLRGMACSASCEEGLSWQAT